MLVSIEEGKGKLYGGKHTNSPPPGIFHEHERKYLALKGEDTQVLIQY